MPKVAIAYSGGVFGSVASNTTLAAVWTAAKKPDGTAEKEPRT